MTIRNELAATRGKAGAYTAVMGIVVTVIIVAVNIWIAVYVK